MLAVTGIGMVSPLGLDVVTSCAAARAGIRRSAEVDDILVNDEAGVEVAKLAVHRVPLVSTGFFGFARLLQLGLAGLRDLTDVTGAMQDGRVGFVLVVGGESYRSAWLAQARNDSDLAGGKDLDAYEATIRASQQRFASDLLAALLQRSGLDTVPEARSTLCTTAAGLVAALEVARGWLKNRVCDRCVVGGIDSLLDPTTLAALKALRLLKTPEHPVGMIPGEAAAFMVVEEPRAAVARRAPVLLMLEETATATATGAPHPALQNKGSQREALPTAITDTFSRLGDGGRATGLTVVNLNGDAYRAGAWGSAVVSVLAPLQLATAELWVPPLFFGDVGAATGVVSIALLARAWARGYAASANALLCLMDDFGGRGTLYARAPA